MNNKWSFSLLVTLIGLLLESACNSGIPTLSPPNEQATNQPSETSAPEQPPTSTPAKQEGYTSVQIPTLNPETLLAQLTTSEVIQDMLNQFKNNGLEQGPEGNWNFWCVAAEEFIRLKDEIELPDGYFVSHTIPCQYYDANGNEQIIQISIHEYNPSQNTFHIEGYGIGTEGTRRGDSGLRNFLSDLGYTGRGHVLRVSFAMPSDKFLLWSRQGYAFDAMEEIYNSEMLEQFATTGDPSVLGGLLLAVDTGFLNLHQHQ